MNTNAKEPVTNIASKFDRRAFLSKTAYTAVVGGSMVHRTAANEAPADKLNIGVIGVGNRGASNIAEIKSENIVALCDVDQQYLEAMSARFPHAKRYSDFRELLKQPDLDAVLISTPDHTHYHAAMMAMQRGLHVYCEKPLAHSIWELREMAAAAKRLGVVTQTGNQHHASDGYRRAVEIIQSGAIGDVKEVHAWTNRPIWPQGIERPEQVLPVPQQLDWNAWLGPAPTRPYHDTYHPRGWRGWFDFGCGALGDMGPHLLDPVVWAFNLGTPTTIVAESSKVNDQTFPTWSIVRFNFSVRDRKPPLKVVWYDGEKQPSEQLTGIKRLPPHGVMFMGARAKLFSPQYGGAPTVLPNRQGDAIELPEPFLPKSLGHHREWITACKRNGTTSCDFSYGSRLTEICLLGNIAIRTGENIQWDANELRAANGVDIQSLLSRDYRAGWEM